MISLQQYAKFSAMDLTAVRGQEASAVGYDVNVLIMNTGYKKVVTETAEGVGFDWGGMSKGGTVKVVVVQ